MFTEETDAPNGSLLFECCWPDSEGEIEVTVSFAFWEASWVWRVAASTAFFSAAAFFCSFWDRFYSQEKKKNNKKKHFFPHSYQKPSNIFMMELISQHYFMC